MIKLHKKSCDCLLEIYSTVNITGFSTVKALISDHLWKKWLQLEVAAHEKELLFKGPRGTTEEDGRL